MKIHTEKCEVMSGDLCGIGTNLTQRATLFLARLPHLKVWPCQSEESCFKLTHVAKQGKVWQTKPLKQNKLLNSLPKHYTSPHITYFAPVCHMSPASKRVLCFSRHCLMSNLWKCKPVHGSLEMCANCLLKTHIEIRKNRNLTALHMHSTLVLHSLTEYCKCALELLFFW